MGNGHGTKEETLLESILCNEEAQLEYILREDNEAVNGQLLNGMTTPMCRAAFLNKRNIMAILLKHGADVNKTCGNRGNTPAMWASWKNNFKMVDFLVECGTDLTLVNKDGLDAMDI